MRAWLGLCDHHWIQTGTIESKQSFFRRDAPETIIRTNTIGYTATLQCKRCGMVKSRKLA